jgi:hypothetical protein
LELLSGGLTPSLQEDLVHLAAWMPFDKAAQALERFRQTEVSRPTTERMTEAAGAAYVAFQNEEVAQIERELPEVKTLVIGEVQPPQEIKGKSVIRTAKPSSQTI